MNLSEKTRKELVLDVLRAAEGGWVNTTEIANAQVGGSEGMRRLRELRADGYTIERRGHPDPKIAQYQYRLVDEPLRPKSLNLRPIDTGEDTSRGDFEKFARGTIKGTIEAEHREGDVRVIDQIKVESVAIDLPYIKWVHEGRSRKARHNDYDLFVYQNWTGNWHWSARWGHSTTEGAAGTREEAMQAAAMETVK